MSDPIYKGSDPYPHFEADRPPTATESVVDEIGIAGSGYDFYWIDISTNPKTRHDFVSGSNGSYVWSKRIKSGDTFDEFGDGSTNKAYTGTDKNKLASIAASANFNIKAYQGTTARDGAFMVTKSAAVSSGIAVFHLTNDGNSNGIALFPNGIIEESINLFVSDSAASYQMTYAMSNSNKTLTVTANKLATANLLTGVLGQAQANGATIKLQVWGY